MIGDAKAPKRRATPEPFKQKNGRSFKTIAPHKDEPDDSGDAGTHAVAHRATGDKPGPVLAKDKQNAGEQRTRRQPAFTQGKVIDEWCAGKRSTYK